MREIFLKEKTELIEKRKKYDTMYQVNIELLEGLKLRFCNKVRE